MWIAWTLVSVCPVRFCLGLIPLKSIPQAECDVLPYNTRLPTLWTPFDGWILGCQRGSHSTTTWLHIKQDTHDKCQECQLWSKVGVHIMVKPIVVAFAAHSVSSCALLRVFDTFCVAPGGLFLQHRVGHWWCTICFWCGFSPGNSYGAEGLVWRWNTPGPSPYDREERHRRLSLLYETGSLSCHETLGSDNMTAGWHVQLLGLIRWLMWNLVGFWGGGVLIACFLARWNRDRLWSLPSSRRRRERATIPIRGGESFSPLRTPGGG